MTPQPSSTSTSHGPISGGGGAADQRGSAPSAPRERARGALQLGPSSHAAGVHSDRGDGRAGARAGAADPQRRGARQEQRDSARITISPGTMNAEPADHRAGGGRATRQAQKIASWVDAGPGSRLQAAMASSNSRGVHPLLPLDAQLTQQRDVGGRAAEPDEADPAPFPRTVASDPAVAAGLLRVAGGIPGQAHGHA